MNEQEVERRFTRYLLDRGWEIVAKDQDDYTDLVARRGGEWLAAELKGETKSAETAIDIGYGQLLRAMARYPDAGYALVIPETLRRKAERVPEAVRRKVDITIYLVPEVGDIRTL